jgi:hypothetical protein
MNSWNPWKFTAIGLVLCIAVGLVTGLVVANWSDSPQLTAARAQGPSPARIKAAPRPAASATAPAAPAPPAVAAPAPAVPAQAAVDACNQHASSVAGPHDKTTEVIKDGVIGAIAGAAVGAAGGAIAGGGKGAGTGAAIGGVVGAGGGTLYGLNENRRHDERYREAYASCMRGRGYTG